MASLAGFVVCVESVGVEASYARVWRTGAVHDYNRVLLYLIP